MTPEPNSRDVTAVTRGICRNMQLTGERLAEINTANGGPGGRYYTDPASFEALPLASGGGDLNGSANQALLLGQAGTNATSYQMPRKFSCSGNFCGIV